MDAQERQVRDSTTLKVMTGGEVALYPGGHGCPRRTGESDTPVNPSNADWHLAGTHRLKPPALSKKL
jgi:hypothetical protein